MQDGQQTVVDLPLQQSAIELNPVVAIGYATVQKHDLTGAVSSISADEFKAGAAPITPGKAVTLTNPLTVRTLPSRSVMVTVRVYRPPAV